MLTDQFTLGTRRWLDGILDLGVFSKESNKIFESSWPCPYLGNQGSVQRGQTYPTQSKRGYFHKRWDQPHPNRDRGCELSKIYDSLLETPRSRTPSTASSKSELVSQHSATIRWGRRRVSLKYSDQTTWVLLNSLKISLIYDFVYVFPQGLSALLPLFWQTLMILSY